MFHMLNNKLSLFMSTQNINIMGIYLCAIAINFCRKNIHYKDNTNRVFQYH